MRIAYMILCHKNPEQINRLIKALQFSAGDDGVDFYIHVDMKSDIAADLQTADNIFLIGNDDRVSIEWAQISSIDALVLLIRAALDSARGYDYLWYMSGQDYPIKSNADIFSFLKKHNGKTFLKGFGPEDHLYYKRFLKRNEIWYPSWILHPHRAMRLLHLLYVLVTGGRRHTFEFFKRRQTPLSNLSALRGDGPAIYYFGSAWFTITPACAKFICNYFSANPAYYEFFRNALIPDESCIVTIVFNSPFSADVQDYLCYVDWSENKRNPKILTTTDYGALITSPYLVARKFDAAVDEEILNMLDKHNME